MEQYNIYKYTDNFITSGTTEEFETMLAEFIENTNMTRKQAQLFIKGMCAERDNMVLTNPELLSYFDEEMDVEKLNEAIVKSYENGRSR